MKTKTLQRTLIAVSLTAASGISSAATVAYGVFDKVKHNDYTDTIFSVSSDMVSQVAKVESSSDENIRFQNRKFNRSFIFNKSIKERRKERRSRKYKNKSDESDEITENTINPTTTTSSLDGLTITGNRSKTNDFTSGTWSYTGTDTIDWLVIKYGLNFGLYKITDGDTSGEWSIADLENFSNDDPTGARFKRGSVKYSAFSHATAYSAITPVPLPAASWLFISGLLGLATISRRKQASRA